MKLYGDFLKAHIGGVGLVLKGIEHLVMHSAFQDYARLDTAGFHSVS